MSKNKIADGLVATKNIIYPAISFIFLPITASGCQPYEPPKEKFPNIVIIYADDLGYGDVGYYNPESKIATPNIDRLAANGMLFTDAHSAGSICSPSRYALLTGRFHWRKVNGISLPFDPPMIDEDELTLPKVLKEQGYQTALIGKWHLGWHWNWKLIDSSSGRIPWGRRMWFNDYEIEMGVIPHNEPAELFDLDADIGQRYNLYATEPEKVKELEILLKQILKTGQVR